MFVCMYVYRSIVEPRASACLVLWVPSAMPFNKQNPLSRHRRSRSLRRAKGTRPEGHEGGAAVGSVANSGAPTVVVIKVEEEEEEEVLLTAYNK